MGTLLPAIGGFKSLRTLVVAIAALAVGGTAALAQDARTVTHELGTTEITGTPSKIVAMEFSFVQALDALGVSPSASPMTTRRPASSNCSARRSTTPRSAPASSPISNWSAACSPT